jgi:hypothetical protein
MPNLLDMTTRDKFIKGANIFKIESRTHGIIVLSGIAFRISPENPIDISKERTNNKSFDTLCNATGTMKDSICLSRAEWYCFEGAILNLHAHSPDREIEFIVKA